MAAFRGRDTGRGELAGDWRGLIGGGESQSAAGEGLEGDLDRSRGVELGAVEVGVRECAGDSVENGVEGCAQSLGAEVG